MESTTIYLCYVYLMAELILSCYYELILLLINGKVCFTVLSQKNKEKKIRFHHSTIPSMKCLMFYAPLNFPQYDATFTISFGKFQSGIN